MEAFVNSFEKIIFYHSNPDAHIIRDFLNINQLSVDFANVLSLEINHCLCYTVYNKSGFHQRRKLMGIEIIGKQIAALRKEKGIKQEELANHVKVSTQAVSKWENGGVPDTELLPKIADFFSVSVDYLFGRDTTDYNNPQMSLCQKILNTPKEERYKMVFNYCWDMENALLGFMAGVRDIEYYEKTLGNKQLYSAVIRDQGFTLMGIANRLQYFLLVPEIEDTESAFFEGIDYLSFLKDFSDKDVFETCVFLYKREHAKVFTEKLLVKNLKIDTKKATDVLDVLEKYKLIYKTQVEMDDDIQTVYKFQPSASFIAFLIFAREMIERPREFSCHVDIRTKPYLKSRPQNSAGVDHFDV